jgi:hypothetical protein
LFLVETGEHHRVAGCLVDIGEDHTASSSARDAGSCPSARIPAMSKGAYAEIVKVAPRVALPPVKACQRRTATST